MSSFDVFPGGDSEGMEMERALADWVEVEVDEIALAEAAKSNPHAFAELYDRYYLRVYKYIYHRLGNQMDAEDLTGQVFMKALEALPGYRPNRKGFAPWIFRIARNGVIDHYRRQRQHRSLDGLQEEALGSDPTVHVLGRERARELHAVFDHLSPEQRDVLLLRYAADLSYSEIAAALGKNETAIRMLVHRGLRKLKAVLDHEDG